jgi:hypothetical protein
MTQKEALKLVRSMACLRDYPKGYPDAEAKLAAVLTETSGADLKLARQIIERFTEQCPTPAQLIEAGQGIRNIQPANSFQDYGETPPILCHTCNDTGVVKGSHGYDWCTCQQGRALQQELPDWVTMLNQFEKKVS